MKIVSLKDFISMLSGTVHRCGMADKNVVNVSTEQETDVLLLTFIFETYSF